MVGLHQPCRELLQGRNSYIGFILGLFGYSMAIITFSGQSQSWPVLPGTKSPRARWAGKAFMLIYLHSHPPLSSRCTIFTQVDLISPP